MGLDLLQLSDKIANGILGQVLLDLVELGVEVGSLLVHARVQTGDLAGHEGLELCELLLDLVNQGRVSHGQRNGSLAIALANRPFLGLTRHKARTHRH